MEEIKGTSNKVLEVNLTDETFSTYEISKQERKMYLGGKGLGLKLLYDRLQPGIDPLGEDNMIAFMTGVIMGTSAPSAARFDAVTKSPLTGIMTSSSCGGPFGNALKTSGWDGLIVKGKSAKQTYLVIDSKGVTFKSAKGLWGKDVWKSQEALKKDGNGEIVIGTAGEKLVKYANVASGHRFLGRGGMGAVLGSKNLKAIVAKGKEFKIVPANKKKFDKARKKGLKYIKRNDITAGSYRNFGTNANVNNCNATGLLPVRNFTGGMHKDAGKISGEYMAEKYDSKFSTCKSCAILCGHKGTFDGVQRQIPEYETTALFGSNLEIFDPVKIAEWNDICSQIGVDTISAAGVIAWVMEATEKGLYKSKLKFGSVEGIEETLKAIGSGKEKELGEGTRYLSEKYGGKDFAIQVKGLEMAAYDPRGSWAQGLSFAVANRGACHVASSVFAIEAFFGMLNPYSTRAKATVVSFFENLNTAINSIHACLFTSFAYTLETPLIKLSPVWMLRFFMMNTPAIAVGLVDTSLWPEQWSGITGVSLSAGKFLKAGKRIQVLERYMNTREGISKKDDTLPGRFLHEGRTSDPKGRSVPLEKMVANYYKVRGFDKNGIPKDKTLKKYKIEKK